jgi:O-antigen/teichoic acid export membrane protein
MIQNSNKRIAVNTLIVYVELFITIVVNLVLSRLVLQALGSSDFGLYNVVGGVIAMFTFISGSLSVSTTRFLNFEMGKTDGDVNKIFNQSHLLHLSFAAIILILLETFGVYYINNILNVEVGKVGDAMFVFQVSTIAACIGIINVPFQSLFTSHEQFSIVAIVNISNVLIKLLAVVALLHYSGNALRFYALGMSLVALSSFIIYHLLGTRRWPEIVKWKIVREWRSYKEQLFYSNWNLLSTASIVGRSQGSALLINLFFGTVVNAAYAISMQVLQQVNNFVGRFDIAVAPQITQNLGKGDFKRSSYLAGKTCRVCILLMEVIFFPLYVELDYILHLWLGDNIPEGALVFCQYTLLIAIVSATSGGLGQLINGTGQIKWFKIQMFIWNMLPLLVGYILYSRGAAPYIIVLLFVIGDILNRCVQLYLLNRKFRFNIRQFVIEAYVRPVIVFVAMFIVMRLSNMLDYNTVAMHISRIFLTMGLTLLLCFYVGLSSSERGKMLSYVRSKINGIKKK